LVFVRQRWKQIFSLTVVSALKSASFFSDQLRHTAAAYSKHRDAIMNYQQRAEHWREQITAWQASGLSVNNSN